MQVDNGEYEIEIIETEIAEGGEVQLIDYTPQFEIISEEPIEIKPKKVSSKKEQPKIEVIQETIQGESYCTVLTDQQNPDLDENGEKKIFRCAFGKCNETFSRRQQCRTHYYNHLATDSHFRWFCLIFL